MMMSAVLGACVSLLWLQWLAVLYRVHVCGEYTGQQRLLWVRWLGMQPCLSSCHDTCRTA